MKFINSMFTLLIYLLKHALLSRSGCKVKGKPVLQHSTNIDAFHIEDSAASSHLGCTKLVLAFSSLSPYFSDKCCEKCEEGLTRKICRINLKQQSVLPQE